MSSNNSTQETLDIMKESEKMLVEELVNKNKLLSHSPSKEGMEKEVDEANAQLDPQSNAKLKLVRSLAVCEESSSPFTGDGPQETQDIIQLHISCPSDKEEEKSSKEESEKEEKDKNKEKGPKKMLSRDSSQEYTDSTGIDVHEFLVNTLKNNPRDRMMLLKLEQDILEFINDNNNQYKKFPQMTSYHRMLLHRVAAYFGMDHNVDQTGKAVIINKTGNTRIPEQRFSEHIKDERNMDFQKKFILKRDDASIDKDDNQIRVPLQDGRRSKSIEEREEEYQRVRDRIFAREVSLNVGNRESSSRASSSRQSSIDGELKCLDPRPWSSTDSDSSSRTLRPPVTKASSFSGISILTRGDSIGSGKGEPTGCRGNRESSSRASSSRQSSIDGELKCLDPRPWSSTDSDSSSRTLRPPVTKASSFSGISILTRGDSIGSGKGEPTGCRFSRTGLPMGTLDLCSQPQAPQTGRSLLPCPSQQAQGQTHQQTGLLPTPQQPPLGNHMMGQADDMGPQFRQMSLSRQGSSEAEPPPALYQTPTVLSQHPPQPGYIMASTGQPIPGSGYQPGSTHPHPPPPPPPPSQPIQVSYYPPGQYPGSSQQYRPLSHQVSYTSQRPQQMPHPAQQSGFLQPQVSEQYQMPQSPSPCNPPQIQQQYSGVAPPGPGVVVMQLSVPNGPQPPQNPPMVQWNQCKYYSMDQRGQKPGELYKPDNGPQANNQMSPLASPTQSPTPLPSNNVNTVCPGLGHLPLIAQFPRPVGPAQVVSRILEVTDLPDGITRTEAEKLFNQLAMSGAKIQWLKDMQGRGDCGGGGGGGPPGKGGNDPANLYTVVAVFPSTMAAQSASFKLNNSTSRFKLRATKKNYDLRILERASSQ
ncbi:R3H domain-containing protein 2 [Acipenser ruthenus]|uniref:R3H domain-containing protein 2 n=1 Tax=Acipenser ruthenus TaxID=7906 RepID=A0A444U8M4_ACIRT|nr:R3H domain-containing protein 2 [Acipenser ruthenus]